MRTPYEKTWQIGTQNIFGGLSISTKKIKRLANKTIGNHQIHQSFLLVKFFAIQYMCLLCVCVFASVSLCVPVYVVCMCVCMCDWTYVCIYTTMVLSYNTTDMVLPYKKEG